MCIDVSGKADPGMSLDTLTYLDLPYHCDINTQIAQPQYYKSVFTM